MQPYLPRPVINYLMCDITNKYIYYTETFSRGGEGGGGGEMVEAYIHTEADLK